MKILLKNKQDWDLVIRAERSWFNLKLKEIWDYRDLLWILVKKEYKTYYKQTVLGPLWFIIQPLITMVVFAFIFNNLAKIETNGIPPYLFYLSGIIAWNYFSDCLTLTSSIFTSNSNLFGKVYFPRIIVPLSKVISGLIKFGIQFFLFVFIYLYFIYEGDIMIRPTYKSLFFIPLMIIQMGILGQGFGMIISSATIKYRDLSYLVNFGTQLLMYASPIVYPLSIVPDKYRFMMMLNPMTSIIEGFRFILLGQGMFKYETYFLSLLFSLLIFISGVIIFNKYEKNFIDSV